MIPRCGIPDRRNLFGRFPVAEPADVGKVSGDRIARLVSCNSNGWHNPGR
jgi:hypothetical protein